MTQSPFSTIEEAIEDIRQGRMVIVVDDPDRENEGDLVMAAELVTPEAMNFMLSHGRGIPCVPTTEERLNQLGIPMMVKENTSRLGTAMAETVDAKQGTTTGVSAFDRAQTVRLLADDRARPEDFARPGHVIPLRAEPGGVLKRAGHTEATVDLCTLAGLKPVGVLCEILDQNGSMARLPELERLAGEHGLRIITIADLIAYRRRTERLINKVAGPINFPTRHGTFKLIAYESQVDGTPYIALTMGDVGSGEPVLVRVHSSCVTGDILDSLRCDCGDQLELALSAIAGEERGCLLYIPHEGRGIGLLNKLKAYELQDKGLDTVEANQALGFKPDLRDYGIGAQVLIDLGIRKLRLLTNNPTKIKAIQGYGLQIVEHVPLLAPPLPERTEYLNTKRHKLGHIIPPTPDIPTQAAEGERASPRARGRASVPASHREGERHPEPLKGRASVPASQRGGDRPREPEGGRASPRASEREGDRPREPEGGRAFPRASEREGDRPHEPKNGEGSTS